MFGFFGKKPERSRQVMIAAPANPFPDSIIKSVTDCVASIEGIAEAHMPLWLEKGVSKIQQSLVVVMRKGRIFAEVQANLMQTLEKALPKELNLGVIGLGANDDLVASVRAVGWQIFPSPQPQE